MLSLSLFSSVAVASHFGAPWYVQSQPGRPGVDCTNIAGVFDFVETINTYDNSLIGTDPTTQRCTGGVGFLLITPECSWQWKRIKNDPDAFCEASSGWGDRSILRLEEEFWQIDADYSQLPFGGVVQGVVAVDIQSFVFTVELIPGSPNEGRRLQGAINNTNGCTSVFEGWATKRESITECAYENQGQFRDINAYIGNYKKRHAQLTSSSSVDVSDVKEALALIARAIPDFTSTGSVSTSTSSGEDAGKVPCADIAGVYQIVETVNEFDWGEVGRTDSGAALCNGGLAYLAIYEGCTWSYKKVQVGEQLPHQSTPIYRCTDDSGADVNGVVEWETEFCRINRVAADANGIDFKFTIEELEGSDATRIQGIYERNRAVNAAGTALIAGPGCDVAFEGWRVARADITPCRDRCYSTSNGDFEEGYFNWRTDLTPVNRRGSAIGAIDTAEVAIALAPNQVNKGFIPTPCPHGLCIVTSIDPAPLDPLVPVPVPGLAGTRLWSQYFRHAGDATCCPSQTYVLSFDAINAGINALADNFNVGFRTGLPEESPILSAYTAAPVNPKWPATGVAGEVVTPPRKWETYRTLPIFVDAAAGGVEFALLMGTTSAFDPLIPSVNGFAFDNFRLQCWGGHPPVAVVAPVV